MNRPIVFMDTETTGLAPNDHIWEWAAIRRETDGRESTYHCFVEHSLKKAEQLPDSYRADHDARYNPETALTIPEFIGVLKVALAGKPHIVGAVPNFDTERLACLLGYHGIEPLWHYHLRDIETMARGYLYGRQSMRSGRFGQIGDGIDLDNSDALSRVCGVEPPTTERHTALGDVRWAMALHDAITEGMSADQQ